MCLYVDDLSYTSSDRIMLNDFKKSMMSEFEMLDLGLMHYILDIEVVQLANGVFTSQKKKKNVLEILDRFKMENCNLVSTLIELGLKLTKKGVGKKVDATLNKQIVRVLCI